VHVPAAAGPTSPPEVEAPSAAAEASSLRSLLWKTALLECNCLMKPIR
jgi:hypothetical protein